MWNFQTGLLMDREIEVSVGWCSVSAQSLLWPNQVPVHIIHYSKSLLSSWVCIPLYYIIRVRNTLFSTEKVFVIHLLKIWFYHSIMKNQPESIRHSHLVRWKMCLYCHNSNTTLSWQVLKLCKFSGEPVADISKSSARFLGYRFPVVSGFNLCISLFFGFAFSIPHETGMHCCSIISPTETLCRLHYFLKVKHKVTWIKIECDMLWLSIFPVKIHSCTKWTENFSATIYPDCET